MAIVLPVAKNIHVLVDGMLVVEGGVAGVALEVVVVIFAVGGHFE